MSPSRTELGRIGDEISTWCERRDVESRAILRLRVALDEHLGNLISHDPVATRARIEITLDPNVIEAIIADDGAPFDPLSLEVAPRPPDFGGQGLTIIRSISEAARYSREGDENRLLLRISRKVSAT